MEKNNESRALHLARVACARAGITQAELARRMGMTPQLLYGRLKTGRITLEEWDSMARALGPGWQFAADFVPAAAAEDE